MRINYTNIIDPHWKFAKQIGGNRSSVSSYAKFLDNELKGALSMALQKKWMQYK